MFTAGHGRLAWYDIRASKLWESGIDMRPVCAARTTQEHLKTVEEFLKLAGSGSCGQVQMNKLLPSVRNLAVRKDCTLLLSEFVTAERTVYRCVQAVRNKKIAWTWFRRQSYRTGYRYYQPFAALDDDSFVLAEGERSNALLLVNRQKGVVRRVQFEPKQAESDSLPPRMPKDTSYNPQEEGEHIPPVLRGLAETHRQARQDKDASVGGERGSVPAVIVQRPKSTTVKWTIHRIALIRALPNRTLLVADNGSKSKSKSCAWLSAQGKFVKGVRLKAKATRCYFTGNCGDKAAVADGVTGKLEFACPGKQYIGSWRTSARKGELEVHSINDDLLLVHDFLKNKIQVLTVNEVDQPNPDVNSPRRGN
jgi:hypothetical protein